MSEAEFLTQDGFSRGIRLSKLTMVFTWEAVVVAVELRGPLIFHLLLVAFDLAESYMQAELPRARDRCAIRLFLFLWIRTRIVLLSRMNSRPSQGRRNRNIVGKSTLR